MKYAISVNDAINAFSPFELKEDNLNDFYYDGTMTSRTGDDEGVSPIGEIYESCIENPKSAYLLLGHIGCGKTTELNWLKMRLEKNGYLVEIIKRDPDFDVLSLSVWDLLVLIANKLLTIADVISCEIDNSILNSLMNFFNEEEEIREFTKEANVSLEAEASAGFLRTVINLFGKLSGEVKLEGTIKTVIRKAVEKKGASVWISHVNKIADAIARKNSGKRPVLIVDDTEKLNSDTARDLFYNYATTLTGMSFI